MSVQVLPTKAFPSLNAISFCGVWELGITNADDDDDEDDDDGDDEEEEEKSEGDDIGWFGRDDK